MSERTIQPAMTPEEWEKPGSAVEGGVDLGLGVIDVSLGLHRGDQCQQQHALAALLLHNQHYGFTWADVALLRWHIAALDVLLNELGQFFDTSVLAELEARREHAEGLAARIAALLPPREP
jgi:hypothetical protein